MSKTFETSVEIKGEIGQSFIGAFRSASDGMTDLKREARAVQKELDRLGNDFRNGKIHQSQYAEETRNLTKELERLERKQKVIDTVKTKASSMWNTTKATASIAAFATAAAGTAVAVKSLNVAADFESQMSKVAAKTDATGSEMKALTQSALELGAKTSLSASESALAMDELAAAGMNVNQIIAAMPGIIAGAEASGEELALVSETVSTALSIWGIEAEKASRVSDVLAMSANISAASVEDFAYAFKYAGKPAADLGLSLEQTAAAISVMTNAGIDGSSAGTSLRAALLKLANPTKKQQQLMKKYGISLKDSTGNAKPLPKLIGEIDKSMSKLTNVDKTAALGTLVGTEAVSGFLTLMSAGEEKLADFTRQLENSAGSSAKASAVMMDNFAGAKEQMLGAFESAQIAAASPSLEVFKQTFNGIASMIEDNIPAIEAAGQNVADVLEEILAPFMYYNEPIKPEFEPFMDPDYVAQAMTEYEEAMSKYNLFGKMDIGDKVDYMLDQTIDHVSAWVEGDGGEKMQALFGELAKIAAGAWSTSFTTLISGSMSELGEGDVGSALAMGMAANAMTGGLLLAGGLAGTKYLGKKGTTIIKNKSKSFNSSMSSMVPDVGIENKKTSKVKATASKAPKNTSAVTKAATSGKLGKLSKVGGKATVPIALATGIYSVATSNNKAEATGSLAGSLGGGVAGAKAGATIGTFIAPGIGTAIGGVVGGLGGSLLGSFVGGKAGNALSPSKASTTSKSTSVKADNSNVMNQLTTSANTVKNNMDSLANMISDASRGIAAINNIAFAAARVTSELNRLEQRIRNSSLNDGDISVRSGARVAYA